MPNKNSEKVKEYKKKYNQRPEVKKKRKEYYQRPKVKVRHKEYYQVPENKERQKINQKKYCSKPEVILKQKKYSKEHQREYNSRPEVKIRINANERRRLKEDYNWNILKRLRRNLRHALKRYSITGKQYTSKKYGINFTKIIEHLKPFPKDIENYQIDHIIPLSLFNFNNPKQVKITFAPSNHQWLTKEQNMEKGNKLIMPH